MQTHLFGDELAAGHYALVGLHRGTVELMWLLDPIDSDEPVLAGVSLLEIRKVEVFVTDHGVSGAIEAGWSSEK